MHSRLISVLFIIVLASAAYAQKMIILSSSGQKVLQERLAEYPVFDEEAAAKEAAERYPLLEEGEEVSVVYRNRQASGIFRGVEGRYIKIGDKNVPIIDLDPKMLSRFSVEENKKLRDRFINGLRGAYERDRELAIGEIQEELYRKYPPLGKKVLAVLFAKIPDEQKKEYADKFSELYDESLPLEDDVSAFLREIAENFLAAHPELVRDGNHFWMKAEKEALEKRRQELEDARLARLNERILFPRTASPVITPDGGGFEPGIEIELKSPTPDAIIHYTLDDETPNEDSPLYEKPIRLNGLARIKAIAYHPEFNDSDVVVSAPWAGGLYGSYFTTMTFKGDVYTRIDPLLDFSRITGAPISGVPADLISMIWTGRLVPRHSEQYTFYITGDDGFRFWIDGQLLINGWKEQPPTEYSGQIQLQAGREYEVKIALAEVQGQISMILEWESPSTKRQLVPQDCLSPRGKYTEYMRRWNHKVVRDGKVYYPYRSRLANPGAHNGSYRLPVRGGIERWKKLGIGD